MNRTLIIFFVGLCVLVNSQANAQTPSTQSQIIAKSDPAKTYQYHFEVSNLPPLKQIAGAPEAHYSYFWEFGDGNYSFDEHPVHAYGDTATVKVNVSLTNNYGSGGVPRINQRKVIVPSKPKPPDDKKKKLTTSTPLSKNEQLKVVTNHSPRPGDPMVCLVSYQNAQTSSPLSGRLYLFYNEKDYRYDNFSFEESRQHHQERFYRGYPSIDVSHLNAFPETHQDAAYAYTGKQLYPVTDRAEESYSTFLSPIDEDSRNMISEASKDYNTVVSWEFKNLEAGEARNIFVTLTTTAEMIKDTTATITLKALIVPEFPGKPEAYTLPMTVRASHDPNEMRVSDRKINKKDMKKNGIVYTIKFQNVGKGAAHTIRIENKLHPSLDPSSIEILDYYPKSVICDDKTIVSKESCFDTLHRVNEISWQLNNIYLPGTRQRDKESRSATHGWIKYKIKPVEHLKRKVPIENQALIYFDKNEAVATNTVRTHVLKNFGAALRVGTFDIAYGFDGISSALSLFPFHSRRFYYQPEVGATILSYQGIVFRQSNVVIGTDGIGNPMLGNIRQEQKFRVAYLDLVPLQIKKDLGSFFSVGLGMQISVLVNGKETNRTERSYETASANVPPYPLREEESTGSASHLFSEVEPSIFLDLQGGLVRSGPTIGLRVNYRDSQRPEDERGNSVYVQLYAQYKF